jgi:geranylgeranyl pyrophosphate synthase
MDNDTYRRGDLTFHAKHGQHSSYIMVYNLLTLIKKIIIEDDDKSLLYLDLEELINYELTNLVAGQKYDLDPTWNKGSRTLQIAELKTASLFKLATMGPFYLLSEKINNDLKDKLCIIGLNLGMAFQLSDDYTDMKIDNESNNYGLETSPIQLKKKYIEYSNLIKQNLKELGFKYKSSIYTIINLMNKRFA